MAPAHSILAAASSSSSSSSTGANHGSCNTEPSGPPHRAVEAKIDELVNDFAEMNPGIDRAAYTWLCRTYFFDANKKGFVYDFEIVFPFLGCSNKANAKRAILGDASRGGKGAGLLRGIDVEIFPMTTSPGTRASTGHGGDRRSEKIMLSWSGLLKFTASSTNAIARALSRALVKLGAMHCNALADDECVLTEKYHSHAKRCFHEMAKEVAADEDTVSQHDEVRDKLAEIHGGQTEVCLPSGGRVDVLCADVAIEVKEAAQWRHAVGQAVAYAVETKRRGRVHLLTVPPKEAFEVCRRLGLELTWGVPSAQAVADVKRQRTGCL